MKITPATLERLDRRRKEDKMNNWTKWMKENGHRESIQRIAKKFGTSVATIHRWKTDGKASEQGEIIAMLRIENKKIYEKKLNEEQKRRGIETMIANFKKSLEEITK